MEKLVAHVGPELEQDVERGVAHDLDGEFFSRGREASSCGRIVEVRDAGSRRVAQDFRVVECVAAGIAAGDQHPGHGVTHAGASGARAFSEVSRILVEERREDGLGEIVSNGLVCVGGSETAGIAFSALAERRKIVLPVGDAGVERGQSRLCPGNY